MSNTVKRHSFKNLAIKKCWLTNLHYLIKRERQSGVRNSGRFWNFIKQVFKYGVVKRKFVA